jgi:hypothetical protein
MNIQWSHRVADIAETLLNNIMVVSEHFIEDVIRDTLIFITYPACRRERYMKIPSRFFTSYCHHTHTRHIIRYRLHTYYFPSLRYITDTLFHILSYWYISSFFIEFDYWLRYRRLFFLPY